MKIEAVEIHNFRQFKGEAKLSFSVHEDKNVTVVHGSNGSGKTSLLNAFKWCFYGETDFDTQTDGILNEAAIDESAVDAEIDLSVKVVFLYEGRRHYVVRQQSFKKVGALAVESVGSEVFTLDAEDAEGITARADMPRSVMLSILPEKLQPYFFFNGERIEKLGSATNASQIRDAIKNLSGLELVHRGIRHLGKAGIGLQKLHGDLGDKEVQEQNEKVVALMEKRDSYKNTLQEVKDEIEELQGKKSAVDDALKAFETAREISAMRDKAEADRDAKVAVSSQLRRDQKKLIDQSAAIVNSTELLAKCSEIISDNRKKGVLPYRVREQFISDLIEEEICVCGRPVAHGTDEYHELLKVKDSAGSQQMEGNYDGVQALLAFADRESSGFKQQYSELSKRLQLNASEIEQLDNKIIEHSNALLKTNLEQVVELEKRREALENQIKHKLKDEGAAEVGVKAAEKEVDDEQAKLTNLTSKLDGARDTTARIKAAERIEAALKELLESLSHQVRAELSERVDQIYQKIMRKDLRAIIDEDYELKVEKVFASGARKFVTEQSTGEKQVSSLSFIASIISLAREKSKQKNRVLFSGGVFPLVMDSPFGALDDDYRAKIAGVIPDFAEQVIIFASNSQWSSGVREACEDRLGAEYMIKYFSPKTQEVDDVYTFQSPTEYEYSTVVQE